MRDFFKRLLDLIASVLVLVLLLPFLVLIAVGVWCRLGWPVLFQQIRPGRDGQLFTMYKFRTMLDARDSTGNFLPDGERLPPFGRWLRSTSLDELPELWNVLRGEMSLVGPRPLLKQYLTLYNDRQRRRHEVSPGITGWAQVNGRNTVDWQTRLEMDVWYVENRTFWLDLKILCLTFTQVLRRDGITADGHDTCPPFEGNPERDSQVSN
jgi:lipopolysaccharide/colanic/teichoic acid biosynthesis glycosyltransferase